MRFFNLLKKNKQDRYDGKPFLKLVDSFVLKCIGELGQSQELLFEKMTPKLQETFKSSGSWEDIVMEQLQYQPEIRDAIRELWAKNKEIAKENGTELSPMQFTEMFVSSNVTT